MPQSDDRPSLYGITENNSSRFGNDLWGKNQFNSTFPLALCLFMRDNNLSPISVISRGNGILADDRMWNMSEVVGEAADELYFHFEKTFDPYVSLSRNEVDKIDLVVSVNGVHTIPLEVKLTVVPDSSTVGSDESEWAPEMVMRPVSSAHAMMSVATSLLKDDNSDLKKQVIDTLKMGYNKISDWSNATEINQNSYELVNVFTRTLKFTESLQKPFLIQPVWRTKGQSLNLCNQCFDVFAWSDVAVLRIPVDQFYLDDVETPGAPRIIRMSATPTATGVSRYLREVARHVRSLYDLLIAGDYDYNGIYKGMAFGIQTDKSFALSGKKNLKYLRHPRLGNPLLSNSILHKLILNRGERELRPERRLDAAVQFHMLS